MSRVVCRFSCGAASAVATKLTLAQHRNVVIVNAFVVEEHADNRRFLTDCERWFGHPITVLRDEKYGASTDEVWRGKRFLVNGQAGAPCSKILKRDVLELHLEPGDIDVLGYTLEESRRADRWRRANPYRTLLTPLIEAGLTHADCLAIVERAGIELPLMYRLGFHNANCVGCVRGGEGYWNKIRRHFPERFEAVAGIQDEIGPGSYLFRDRHTGERYSLRQLPPDKGRYEDEPDISCSFFCLAAEREMDGVAVDLDARGGIA